MLILATASGFFFAYHAGIHGLFSLWCSGWLLGIFLQGATFRLLANMRLPHLIPSFPKMTGCDNKPDPSTIVGHLQAVDMSEKMGSLNWLSGIAKQLSRLTRYPAT